MNLKEAERVSKILVDIEVINRNILMLDTLNLNTLSLCDKTSSCISVLIPDVLINKIFSEVRKGYDEKIEGLISELKKY